MSNRAFRGKKQTEHISLHAAQSLHHAGRASPVIATDRGRRRQQPTSATTGVPLNVFVSIKYSLSESGEDNFDRLRNERYCRWLRTRSRQLKKDFHPQYKYVRENDHVHWTVHIPDELYMEFCDLVPRWVTSLEPGAKIHRKAAKNHHQSPAGCVDIGKVRSSLAVRRYMLKGIDPKHAGRFGIRKPKNQGTVMGKRAGVSRSLCRAALKRLGYKPKPNAAFRGQGRVFTRDQGAHQDREPN